MASYTATNVNLAPQRAARPFPNNVDGPWYILSIASGSRRVLLTNFFLARARHSQEPSANPAESKSKGLEAEQAPTLGRNAACDQIHASGNMFVSILAASVERLAPASPRQPTRGLAARAPRSHLCYTGKGAV